MIIHPLLHKLATHPGLFFDHASGYAELATLEAQAVVRSWRRRALLLAAAALLGLFALLLTGMAALLAASIPLASMPLPGLLLALPLAAWAACALCAWIGLREPPLPAFGHLREQWNADLQLMRDVAAADA